MQNLFSIVFYENKTGGCSFSYAATPSMKHQATSLNATISDELLLSHTSPILRDILHVLTKPIFFSHPIYCTIKKKRYGLFIK